MISKELFCELLKLRDMMFHKNSRISMFFEDAFMIYQGSIPDCDAIDAPMDKLVSILAEEVSDTEGLIRLSLGLEDDDPDITEVEGNLDDQTVRLIHNYEELYDYFVVWSRTE